MVKPTTEYVGKDQIKSNIYSTAEDLAKKKEAKAQEIIKMQQEIRDTYETPRTESSGEAVQKIQANSQKRDSLTRELAKAFPEYTALNNDLYVAATEANKQFTAYKKEEQYNNAMSAFLNSEAQANETGEVLMQNQEQLSAEKIKLQKTLEKSSQTGAVIAQNNKKIEVLESELASLKAEQTGATNTKTSLDTSQTQTKETLAKLENNIANPSQQASKNEKYWPLDPRRYL